MDPILSMNSITKQFPGVKALDAVNFSVAQGEIHALVGENGAGKSTLIKILSGVYPYGSYQGTLIVDGKVQAFPHIAASEEAGIAVIYQELSLIPQLSIAENVFLGHEIRHGWGFIDWQETFRQTQALLYELGLRAHPHTRVSALGVGEQQLVEIAKAMGKKARILVLDEPTAALTESEANILLALLRQLKSRGVTCVYISHRLQEVMFIADRVTVLRDGQSLGTYPINTMSEERMVHLMVGREMNQRFPPRVRSVGPVVLDVQHWTVRSPVDQRLVCRDINFQARKGEVLGIAGLMGAGRSELVMSLFGVSGQRELGTVRIEGKETRIRSAAEAIAAGLALVSEDRKKSGLILGMDIKSNSTLAHLQAFSTLFGIDSNREIMECERLVKSLHIKTSNLEQKVGLLSGGNQQKVVLAKWLMTEPKILILDEPTRGIDVGAKYEIYTIINKLAAQGVCIIMISSELNEVLGMSDRILVMHEGRITAELIADQASQELIMLHATGRTIQTAAKENLT